MTCGPPGGLDGGPPGSWRTGCPAGTRCMACCPGSGPRSSACSRAGTRSTGRTARWATAALREAIASGDRDAVHHLAGDGQVPLLLAISDNGPQMTSVTTREFMAGVAIAQQFGRPHTPQDQAWIETLFGHVKGEWPHLEKIRDPGELDLELDRVRAGYNTVRLHAAIGYVTPGDEHEGRGEAIRQARRDGIVRARMNRIAYRRSTTIKENQ